MSETNTLTTEEGRLIAVYRAIRKFGRPDLITTLDASFITGYISEIIDLDTLEELASSDQIEYFLDGLILGVVASKLIQADIEPEQLPKPREERAKQFQTGVDPKGEVRVNTR